MKISNPYYSIIQMIINIKRGMSYKTNHIWYTCDCGNEFQYKLYMKKVVCPRCNLHSHKSWVYRATQARKA